MFTESKTYICTLQTDSLALNMRHAKEAGPKVLMDFLFLNQRQALELATLALLLQAMSAALSGVSDM